MSQDNQIEYKQKVSVKPAKIQKYPRSWNDRKYASLL